MSERTKRNISVIIVGTILIFFIAPSNILPILRLVVLTAAVGTVFARLFFKLKESRKP